MNPEALLEENSVRLHWSHLNPKVQKIIGSPLSIKPPSIRAIRKIKLPGYGAVTAQLLLALNLIQGSPLPAGFWWGAAPLTFAETKALGQVIRNLNADLMKAMRGYGILQPKFEELYPKKWLDPSMVARTHSIFYVARNGDLVFRKPTRMEYYQYLWQKKLPGRMGFHVWRWRVYLRPPEAPQPWKEWAKERLQRELKKLKPLPRPLPRPVPGGTFSKRKRLRRAPVRA